MKLAIVTAYPPSESKLAEYGSQLVKHFRMQPEVSEIILLTEKHKKQIIASEQGCPVTVQQCWSFNGYSNIIKVTQKVLQFKPDAVFFNLESLTFGNKKIPATLGFMIPFFSRVTGIATISLLHSLPNSISDYKGFTLIEPKGKKYGRSLTKMVLASDLVAVTKERMVDLLKEKFDAANVAKVPFGTFDSMPEPDYRLAGDKKQVLTFGEFGSDRKLANLLEAVQRIRARRENLDIEVIIASTESVQNPGYIDSVQRKFKHMPDVHFVNVKNREELAAIIEPSALVVLPEMKDTENLKDIQFAASHGKALVLPYFENLNRAIEEWGYRSEVYTHDCPESLSEAIENVLVFNSYRIHLGMANYKASVAYPIENSIRLYIEYFKAIKQSKSNQKNLEKTGY